MSYAIIKNAKYKMQNLTSIYRHIERKNENYLNKDIKKELSKFNYSFKSPQKSYAQLFHQFQAEDNLKCSVRSHSNIVCEYIIRSDQDFYDNISPDETRRFFKTAYDFVCKYKNLGEKYILSATVHMDEVTPHMHLVYLPVVHKLDKDNNKIDRLACSEFWREKNSYNILQNDFYKYLISNGFNLEKGFSSKLKNLSIYDFKAITNFNKIKEIISKTNIEELNTNSIELSIAKNKELVKYCHKLETYCISSFNIFNQLTNYELQINNLKQETKNLKQENQKLKDKLRNSTIFINNMIKVITSNFNLSRINLLDMLKQGRFK